MKDLSIHIIQIENILKFLFLCIFFKNGENEALMSMNIDPYLILCDMTKISPMELKISPRKKENVPKLRSLYAF